MSTAPNSNRDTVIFTIFVAGVALVGIYLMAASIVMTEKQVQEAHRQLIERRCIVHGDWNGHDTYCHYVAERKNKQ